MYRCFLGLLIAIIACISSYAQVIGSKISMVATDGKTYTGIVTEIQGEKYRVKYDGYDFYEWLLGNQFKVIDQQPANNVNVLSEEALMAMAKAYYASKQYDLVIENCNKALKINSSNAYAYNVRGTAYVKLDNFDQAIADFTQAIKITPDYSNAYLQRAIAYKQKGNSELAIADYAKVIALEPGNEQAYYNRGNLFYSKEKYSQAITDYNQVIKLNSKFPDYYLQRGVSYYYLKNYDQAISDYTQAILLLPDYSLAYTNRALAYEVKGNTDLALADYEKAIQSNPNTPLPYSNRAALNLKIKNYEAAIDDYSRAIKFDPKNLWNYINRANSYANASKYDLALADANMAIQLDPTNTNAYLTRGWTYAKLEKFDNAIQDYNIAIAQLPKYGGSYSARGWVYKSLGEYDLALADFERSIQLEPQNSEGYTGRAVINYYKGGYDLAITDLNKAVEIDPKNSTSYDILGNVYYSIGNYPKASISLKQAIKLDPDNAISYQNLFTNLLRVGDLQTANEYYKIYKSRNLKSSSHSEDWKFYDHYITAITQGVLSDSYDLALKELYISEDVYSSYKIGNSNLKEERKYGFLDILFLKGYILEKLGKYNEAKVAYEQALVINKNQTDLKTALKRLEDKNALVIKSDNTPPDIQLISPQASRSFDIVSDKDETQIVGRAKDPSGIDEIKINGTAIKAEDDGLFITNLSLKPGDNAVLVSATDKQGNTATKSFIIIGNSVSKKEPAPTELNNIPVVGPNAAQYHAILIAEKDYQDPAIPDLENPVKDAKELKAILEAYYMFSPENIDTLYNRSREDIMQAIIQKCNSLKEKDNLLIFYAGHGTAEKDKFGDVDGYWIPTSAKKGSSSTYISADDINKALKRSNSRHILVIADACFSGSFTRDLPPEASVGIQKQYKVPSRKIMSSGNLEPVPDNSRFIYYIKKNLKENTEKYLTSKKLFDSFYEAILNNSETSPQYAAIKNVGDEGGEFIFIKK